MGFISNLITNPTGGGAYPDDLIQAMKSAEAPVDINNVGYRTYIDVPVQEARDDEGRLVGYAPKPGVSVPGLYGNTNFSGVPAFFQADQLTKDENGNLVNRVNLAKPEIYDKSTGLAIDPNYSVDQGNNYFKNYKLGWDPATNQLKADVSYNQWHGGGGFGDFLRDAAIGGSLLYGGGALADALGAGAAAAPAATGAVNLGTATGADLSAAYDMGAVGANGAGGYVAPAAAAAGAAGATGAVPAGAAAAAAPAAANALSSYATPAAIAASSLLGAKASQNAADTQAAATDRANQIALQMYQEQKALQAPYVAGGVTAQNKLLTLLGLPGGDTTSPDYGSANKNFTPSDLTTDPSYQFRLNEGLKALDRQAAARGGLISGGALKAAQTYGQDQASQEYQNAFNRYQTNRANMLQPLGNLIASGQNAAANTGTAAGNYGTTAGNNITSGAAAQAAGTVGQANALSGGVSQYLNYSNNNNLLNLLAQRQQTQQP